MSRRLPLFLLGAEDHHHLPPFHLGRLLDDADRGQITLDPFQDIQTEIAVRMLAPAKTHGDLGLVPFIDETRQAE
jgi:hypothetical protein